MDTNSNKIDPTKNVLQLVEAQVKRIDDLARVKDQKINEKVDANDDKYQIQFAAAKELMGTALIAQEKAMVAALENTKEAVNKAGATTDKRFDLLSEKIDGIGRTISVNAGAQGLYVTHDDLNQAIDKLQTSIENTLRPVVAFMNAQTGQQQGISTSWGVLIGAVGFIATLIAIFFALSK